MIAEAVDTLITLGWALAGWLIFFATVASILTLAAIATGAWAARGAWRAVTGPSWRRGRVRAGNPCAAPSSRPQRAHRASDVPGGSVIARALAVGICLSPFISAARLALHRVGRALRQLTHRKES